jgi:hypothetical protein
VTLGIVIVENRVDKKWRLKTQCLINKSFLLLISLEPDKVEVSSFFRTNLFNRIKHIDKYRNC